MERQDLNGYRTPEEVVRRWDLSKIELNEEDIEQIKRDIVCDTSLSLDSEAPVQNKTITAAINTKVTKVSGKGLSTNDFTDEDKDCVHYHENKTLLDGITAQRMNHWDTASFSVDFVYPIGSIYMSVNNTDPSLLFDGTTWTQIKDVFLLSAGDTYTAGTTGGSANLQQHNHGIPALSGATTTGSEHTHVVTTKTTSYASGSQTNWRSMSFVGTNADYTQTVYTNDGTSDGTHYHGVTTTASTTGDAGTGNSGNMPPYLTVYMWKRVS
jgi:hypothetical protein